MTSLAVFLGVFFYFSFMFILDEFEKNRGKSQKNHKMENPILLDFMSISIQ